MYDIANEEAGRDEILEYQDMCNNCSDIAYSVAHTSDPLHKRYFIKLFIQGLEIHNVDLKIVQEVLNEIQQGNHT